MHISALPVEVLKQCLGYVRLPASSESVGLPDREKSLSLSLSPCCLVCQLWCSLAQPMLFERVQLDIGPEAKGENRVSKRTGFRSIACFGRTCQARPDLAARTKRLHFGEPAHHKGRAHEVDARVPVLLQRLPCLRDLLVSARAPFDLAWLGDLPGKRTPLSLSVSETSPCRR